MVFQSQNKMDAYMELKCFLNLLFYITMTQEEKEKLIRQLQESRLSRGQLWQSINLA